MSESDVSENNPVENYIEFKEYIKTVLNKCKTLGGKIEFDLGITMFNDKIYVVNESTNRIKFTVELKR